MDQIWTRNYRNILIYLPTNNTETMNDTFEEILMSLLTAYRNNPNANVDDLILKFVEDSKISDEGQNAVIDAMGRIDERTASYNDLVAAKKKGVPTSVWMSSKLQKSLANKDERTQEQVLDSIVKAVDDVKDNNLKKSE